MEFAVLFLDGISTKVSGPKRARRRVSSHHGRLACFFYHRFRNEGTLAWQGEAAAYDTLRWAFS